MEEGTCDYWAATMLATPHVWAWHRRHDEYKIHRRSLRSCSTMEAFDADERADPHENGTIWGAALWNLRESLSQDRADGARIADLLVLLTVAMTLVTSPVPRYFIMVLPLMVLSWLVLTERLARQLLEADEYYDVEVVDLLAVENTVGGYGGTILPVEELRAVRKVADDQGVPIHLDGARMWNAAAALRTDVRDWTGQVDTLMFCLSKGLGAPIGSLICGPADLIEEARRIWILFGGAWRQAGIMAAAGLVALEEGRDRLVEDHARAQRLGGAIHDMAPGAVDLEQIATNMVFVHTEAVGIPMAEAIDRLAARGVGAVPMPDAVRMVTHADVDDEGIARAIDAWKVILDEASKET